MTFIRTLALGASLAFVAAGADAATFGFSYGLAGDAVISGAIEGEVQGDLDTVLVGSVGDVSVNGASAPALPFVDAFTNFEGASGLPPTVSFSGASMDLIACADAICSEGFLFGPLFPELAFASSAAFLGGFEPFEPARWSLTPAAVPLPASALLLAGALGGLAALRRRAG